MRLFCSTFVNLLSFLFVVDEALELVVEDALNLVDEALKFFDKTLELFVAALKFFVHGLMNLLSSLMMDLLTSCTLWS